MGFKKLHILVQHCLFRKKTFVRKKAINAFKTYKFNLFGGENQTWSTFPAICPQPHFGKSCFVQNTATLAVLSIKEVLIYTTLGFKNV